MSHVLLIVEFSRGFELRRSRMRGARIYFLIQVSGVVMISLSQQYRLTEFGLGLGGMDTFRRFRSWANVDFVVISVSEF